MGVVSPQRAVALLEQLPDSTTNRILHQAKTRARWGLVAMLARPGERRWKYLALHFFGNWVPDIEDIGGEF